MSSLNCASLPASTCPTAPAYNECHQIATYDDSSFTRRHPPASVQDSVPQRNSKCFTRPYNELSGLKVCGDAVVDCSVQTPLLKYSSSGGIATNLIATSLLFLQWLNPNSLTTPVVPFDSALITPSLLLSGGVFTLPSAGLYRLSYNLELDPATLGAASYVSVALATHQGDIVIDTRALPSPLPADVFSLSGSLTVPVTSANEQFTLQLSSNGVGNIAAVSASLLAELLTTSI